MPSCRYIRRTSVVSKAKTDKDHAREILRMTAPHSRSGEELEILCRQFRKLEFFKEFSNELIKTCAQMVTLVEYEADSTVIKQGETGHQFYIVFSGTIEMYVAVNWNLKTREVKRIESADIVVFGKPQGVFSVGQGFGERAISHPESKRAATGVAAVHSELLRIEGAEYLEHVSGVLKQEHAARIRFMADTSIYSTLMWTTQNLEALVRASRAHDLFI